MDAGDLTGTIATFVVGVLSPFAVLFGTLWLERKQRGQDRRDASQKEALLALQDNLYEILKHTTDSALHRKKVLEETGAWKGVRVPPDTWTGMTQSVLRAPKLMVRVEDQEVRRHADRFVNALVNIHAAPDLGEWERQFSVAHGYLRHANERIGKLLRKL